MKSRGRPKLFHVKSLNMKDNQDITAFGDKNMNDNQHPARLEIVYIEINMGVNGKEPCFVP